MKFQAFAEYLQKLEETSSRIEITKILAELFKKTSVSEIDKAVYLSLGTLAPSFREIVFNLADRMMIRVIVKAYQKNSEEVMMLYRKLGDLGDVAERFAKGEGQDLSISNVYDCLVEIAKYEGEGSQEKKVEGMARLLSELDPLSSKFVSRIPVGRLRLGFSDKTILDALSWMEKGDKSLKGELDSAYQVLPDVGLLAKKVKEMGVLKASKNINPVIGIPVAPMLAQRLKTPTEMIKKMGKVSVEPKFDGLRLLIHFKRPDFLKAFTRNLNDVSNMFPELKNIGSYINAREVILDSETVGMDSNLVKMVDFQTTMQRRRKHDIETLKTKIPVTFQIFDIIYKDGQNLMNKSYIERRNILKDTFKKGKTFVVDEFTLTDKAEVIRSEHQEMVDSGLEGVIVKKADSAYVPGRTGWRWVKMKEAEEASGKLSDTVDCVVMGYSSGKGKRVSFGMGQFLVGVRKDDRFVTVSKVGTGLTDAEFRELEKRLSKLKISKMPKEYDVHKNLEPDFWVIPKVVVEIAADNMTKSPTHTAGFALRFPRLIKFRDDKSPQQATTASEVKKLFEIQKG